MAKRLTHHDYRRYAFSPPLLPNPPLSLYLSGGWRCPSPGNSGRASRWFVVMVHLNRKAPNPQSQQLGRRTHTTAVVAARNAELVGLSRRGVVCRARHARAERCPCLTFTPLSWEPHASTVLVYNPPNDWRRLHRTGFTPTSHTARVFFGGKGSSFCCSRCDRTLLRDATRWSRLRPWTTEGEEGRGSRNHPSLWAFSSTEKSKFGFGKNSSALRMDVWSNI